MAGNKQKKSFSFFSFFKAKKGRRDQDYTYSTDDVWSSKVFPSDEDNTLKIVAEPGIDKKASAFIVKFHATRLLEAS